jgi:hypothetical protein
LPFFDGALRSAPTREFEGGLSDQQETLRPSERHEKDFKERRFVIADQKKSAIANRRSLMLADIPR